MDSSLNRPTVYGKLISTEVITDLFVPKRDAWLTEIIGRIKEYIHFDEQYQKRCRLLRLLKELREFRQQNSSNHKICKRVDANIQCIELNITKVNNYLSSIEHHTGKCKPGSFKEVEEFKDKMVNTQKVMSMIKDWLAGDADYEYCNNMLKTYLCRVECFLVKSQTGKVFQKFLQEGITTNEYNSIMGLLELGQVEETVVSDRRVCIRLDLNKTEYI